MVFSTYVEVIPKWINHVNVNLSILHVCGGDPSDKTLTKSSSMYSPRMWRWSCQCLKSTLSYLVFSTYVEVILFIGKKLIENNCILHVCGGDPCCWWWLVYHHFVFSTYVEVILKRLFVFRGLLCILHVCGGDPPRQPMKGRNRVVFSTYVEVIPWSH